MSKNYNIFVVTVTHDLHRLNNCKEYNNVVSILPTLYFTTIITAYKCNVLGRLTEVFPHSAIWKNRKKSVLYRNHQGCIYLINVLEQKPRSCIFILAR